MSFSEMKAKNDVIQQAVKESIALIEPSQDNKGIVGMEVYVKTLHELSEGLKTSMFKILFMGTFKNGKSTTINAFLGEELLPVGVLATTAIITQVVYGENDSDAYVYKNGSPNPEKLSLKKFNDEYKLSLADMTLIQNEGSFDRFKDVDYVLLKSNREIFKNGVQFIDSPGLEEAVSRTKATENFFPKANAIIFLLDATKLLSFKEKLFIQQHFVTGDAPMRNIFFVANRINSIEDPQGVLDVKRTLPQQLAPVFSNKGVVDNDLMKKRIFFADSLRAFKMKKQGQDPVGTDIDRFQKELEAFLTSEEKVTAVYQSVMANMAATYLDAQKNLGNWTALMKTPLGTLQANHAASERILNDLESDIRKMINLIDATESVIREKIFNNLIMFLRVDLPNIWAEHSQTYDGDFGIVDLIKVALPHNDDVTRREIMRPMSVFINDFVHEQLKKWGENCTTLVKPDLDKLSKELSESGKEFSLDLLKAQMIFKGIEDYVPQDNDPRANKLQIALSMIQGDVSSAVINAGGGNFSWGEFFKRYLVQALANTMIFAVLGGGIPALLGLIVFELAGLRLGANSTRDRILNKFAERLFVHMEKNVTEKRSLLEANIHKQFEEQGNILTQTANDLITAEREKQEKILADIKHTEAEIKSEQERQENLLKEFRKKIDLVYQNYTGNENRPTERKLKEFAASIAVGGEN